MTGRLRHEVEFLRGERSRLERLLGFVLGFACQGQRYGPSELLTVSAAVNGENLARAAVAYEAKPPRLSVDELVELMRETDPAAITGRRQA